MSEPATRIADVRDQIARAAKAARRKAEDVVLVAVTKQRGVEEIEPLIAAGIRNSAKTGCRKRKRNGRRCGECHPDLGLHWIGRLQSNKAEEAVELFDAIHRSTGFRCSIRWSRR